MGQGEERIKKFMHDNGIKGEHFSFQQSCHSVEQAASAAKADILQFVKNICMTDGNEIIVAIVKGEDKASISKAETVSGKKLRMATPEEIMDKTGYPCGGTPSFGYRAIFIIDERVMEQETVYTSGGSEMSLVRINAKEMAKANNGIIANVRK